MLKQTSILTQQEYWDIRPALLTYVMQHIHALRFHRDGGVVYGCVMCNREARSTRTVRHTTTCPAGDIKRFVDRKDTEFSVKEGRNVAPRA